MINFKKIILTLFILLSTIDLQADFDKISYNENTIELGLYKDLEKAKNKDEITYFQFNKNRRKDIIELQFFNDNSREVSTDELYFDNSSLFQLSYVLKLVYEEDIDIGPKIYYIRINDDDLKIIGIYSSFVLNEYFKLYVNYLSDYLITNKEEELYVRYNFDIRLNTNIKLNKDFEFYSNFIYRNIKNNNSSIYYSKDKERIINIEYGIKYLKNEFEYGISLTTPKNIKLYIGYKY